MINVDGFLFAGIHAGIKQKKKDLALIYAADGAEFAAVTTTNKFGAAGVQYTQALLKKTNMLQAVMVNSGNANALTGDKGIQDISDLLTSLGQSLPKINMNNSVLLSTGIIGKHLPIKTMTQALPSLAHSLNTDATPFAEAIMTTDLTMKTSIKTLDIDGRSIQIVGICKGSGMIQPNMATMHGFILTNAEIPSSDLRSWIKDIADSSFNRITVDSDASTNDTLMLLASGKGSTIPPSRQAEFRALLKEVAIDLAQQIIQDGEGCTKFVTFTVDHALNQGDARAIFFAVCNSPLVKTAWFGENPNFGRILCSAGKIESSLVAEKVDLWMGPHLLVKQGAVVPMDKAILDAYMKNRDLTFRLDLNQGSERFTGWTTGLSYEYVKINAEYN